MTERLHFTFAFCCFYLVAVMSNPLHFYRLQPAWLLCPWDFLVKNTGMGLLFPSSGDLPNQNIKPMSPGLAGRVFTTEPIDIKIGRVAWTIEV